MAKMLTPGSYTNVPLETVHWGMPFEDGVAEVVESLGHQRILIVCSNTLRRKTNTITRLENRLDPKVVGIFSECIEHTPFQSVLTLAEYARKSRPDIIVTVGGSTPIDTVKIALLALDQNLTTVDELRDLADQQNTRPTQLRQIIVPTTLSGGEFTSIAGGTDLSTKTKHLFYGSNLCGQSVILDPALTYHTPEWLWFSTAVRAIDHAIEGILNPDTNPMIVGQGLHAISLMFANLRKTKSHVHDLPARLACQQAVWLTTVGLGRVSMGASHGIGYILGTVGNVPHGHTSCVMLPSVLRWNEPETKSKQLLIAKAMGDKTQTPSQQLTHLLQALDLPLSLTEVGIQKTQLEVIAARAAGHPIVRANARAITSAEDVMEILELGWNGAQTSGRNFP